MAGPLRPDLDVGLGFKPEHHPDVMTLRPPVGFWEVHAENYMASGGPWPKMLETLRADYPVTLHGVGLSIGGEGPLDTDHLRRVADLVRRVEPAAYSEHLAWSSHGHRYFNDLLPLPYRPDTLQRVCDHIDTLQEQLGQRILLENPSSYVQFASSTLTEGAFLSAVVQRTGCGLLLDVNNLYVSAINHGHLPEHDLQEMPLHAIGQIHLAGHTSLPEPDGGVLLIDDHGSQVTDAVWALYRTLIQKVGRKPTLIEWDQRLPAFEVLIGEACQAQSHMDDLWGVALS